MTLVVGLLLAESCTMTPNHVQAETPPPEADSTSAAEPATLLEQESVSEVAGETPTLELIRYVESGGVRLLKGSVLVTAQDSGLLVLSRFGELYTIPAEAEPQRSILDATSRLASREEQAAHMQEVIGNQGTVVQTEHYVIVSTGSREFADWCSLVLDQFHSSLLDGWNRMGLETSAPPGPLPVLILGSRDEYVAFVTRDASVELAQTRGYYSMRTNRVVLQDPLADGPMISRPRTPREVDRRLASHPWAVGTLLHEATHQAAYNCGLHRRYADNPMWLTEGLAMCVEPSDARSQGVDVRLTRPNQERLNDFRTYLRQRRQAGSLEELLTSEACFQDPDRIVDAYAESWALTWFLIRTRPDEYVRYLELIAAKPLLIWDDPPQRLADFEGIFGEVPTLEREFLRWISSR